MVKLTMENGIKVLEVAKVYVLMPMVIFTMEIGLEENDTGRVDLLTLMAKLVLIVGSMTHGDDKIVMKYSKYFLFMNIKLKILIVIISIRRD